MIRSIWYSVFFLILIVNASFAQSFIDTSKTWHVGQGSGWVPGIIYTEAFQFKNDSVVNSTSYKVLKRSIDSTLTNWNVVGLFREDTLQKKVFWLINNQEELLYDFSLNVGDTAKVVSSFGMPYPGCSFEMIVDSINYLDYNGVLRKTFYFNTYYYNSPERWIEGIGNLFGIIENKVMVCTADYVPDLLCYKENGNLKYINPTYNSCYLNSVNINENNIGFNCGPNPSNGQLKLTFDNALLYSVDIINIKGEPIYSFQGEYSSLNIELKERGIYFLRVTEGFRTEMVKLIVL